MNPVVHFELPAEDPDRMSNFYREVFGWETNKMGEEYGGYITVMTTESDKNGPKTPGAINGGIYKKTDEMPPQHPRLVIKVPDINEAIEKVKQSGGKVEGEPMDIPNLGPYVSFIDTEGNAISMIEYRNEK